MIKGKDIEERNGSISEAFRHALEEQRKDDSSDAIKKDKEISEAVKKALKKSEVVIVEDKNVKPLVPKYPKNSEIIYYNPNIHGYAGKGVQPVLQKCIDCNYEKRDTVNEAVEDILNISNEELLRKFDEFIKNRPETEKCHPETCYGECQGMGWCNIATEFRERIKFQPIFHIPNFLRKKKKKKTQKKHLRELRKQRNKFRRNTYRRI